MPPDKVCKTIHQYNRGQVSAGDMEKLQEIALDQRKVKNIVYARYGGIGSLSKLYPGYTIQNEMTATGLREHMGVPAVYFYLAIFDALGDIKAQWSRTKRKVLESVDRNTTFSDDEKHYLRYLLKVSNAFGAAVEQKPIVLPGTMQKTYRALASRVDTEKLHRYLCRQVRRYHVKLHTDRAKGFPLSERAYRYGDHGIYISIKEKRKRIFIPLTDNNQYKRQIYLKLFPAEGRIQIDVPVDVTVQKHANHVEQVGIALGMQTMLTTDGGGRYGEDLGELQSGYTDWLRIQTGIRSRDRGADLGRKKYEAKKARMTERLHSYINHELNRFLQTEKPAVIYMAKLPRPGKGGIDRKINLSVSLWQRGYIRRRLEQKCREHSVELVEVLGKDISNRCSACGAMGSKEKGIFSCPVCGRKIEEKVNTAQNAKRRGQDGQTIIRS